MPQVVPFLIKIGAAVTFGAAAGTAAAVIGATVLVAGTFAASRLLKPKINFNVDDSDRSRQQTVRSTIEPRKLVYGETMVSGPLTYAKVTGTNNEYLHQVIALAGHELTAIKEVYFDDKSIDLTGGNYNSSTKLVTGGFFGPKNNENGVSESIVYIDTRLGAATQSPFTALRNNSETSGEYLSTHRGDGVASIYTRWLINEGSAEVWDEVGKVQNIKCVVQGKKVYDPRLDVNAGNDAGDNATASTYKTYNDGTLTTGSAQGNYNRGNQGENPALQLADFLMDSDFGLGIAASKIDWDAVVTAADICDQLVPIPTSAVQKRFFGSGVIFGADTYSSSIEKILSAMNGSLIYSQGKYIMTAGKYVSPSETLTENDLVGPVQIQTAVPRADRVNTIKGLFIDPSENYKMMEFGPVTVGANDFNSDVNNPKVGAVARDNGEVLTEEIKLPFTDNRYAAQRLALMQVAQSYHQTIITVPVNMKGMRIAIGDRVNLTLTDFESIDSGNWSPKVFKCIGWSFAEDGDGVNLTLLEDDSLNYNDPEEEDYSTITAAGVISTALPDVPSPSDLTLTAGINSIELNWTNPSNIGAWEQIYIYRDTSNTTPTDSSTPIARLRASSYIDQRAAADSDGNAIEYYYWIQAVRYPQGSTPAGGSTNAAKSPMVAASTPASGKIAATKIGQGVMDDDSVGSAQVIDGNIGSDQIATTIQSDNWATSSGTAGWQINKSGAASFQTATITGTITANDGTIGGTTITSTSLYQYSGSGSQSHGDADTDFYLDSSGNFSLKDKFVWTGGSTNTLVIDGSGTFSGTLSSVDGTFTGALSGGTISIGSNNDIFKADSNGIYLGNATFASAPFRVTPAGALTATNATITGAVTATSLTIDEGATLAASSAFTRTPFVSFTSIGQTAFSPAVSGSEVTWTQVSGSYSWNHKLVSDKAFKNGAFVSFRVKSAGDINTRYMVGLADVNTGTSFTQIDYAIYIRGSASTPDILAYESGSSQGELKSTLNVGDVCTVLYDDEKIKYIINGVVERTVDLSSSPITDGLYAHIAIDDGANDGTHTIEDFRFGSISDLALGVTIQDGGITMADGGSIKGGQTGYDTGTGFFLGYDSAYKFSIGNSGGNKLTFDGQDLTVTGAVNATSGDFSGQVAVGSTAGTITVIDGNDTDYRMFTNATLDTDTNQYLPDDSSFKVGNDGRVFASNITIYNEDGDVLLSPTGLGAAALNDISTTSGSVVSTVGGTVSNSTSEITLTTSSASESFTITSKVAINDNYDGTQYFSGASTSSTANAEAQLTGVDVLIDYYVKADGGSYGASPDVTKTVTIVNSGTPTSTQMRVGGFDRGASYSGSLTRYFAVLQDFGGALEFIPNSGGGASSYVVTTASLGSSLFPSAQTYKIKIVMRVVEDGTTTEISGSTTPPSSDNTTTGIYFDGGNSDERHYEITGTGLIKNSDNTFTSGSQNLLASGGTISGDLTVTGDLTIQGTTTTIDTANLNVEDKNITLNYGTGDTSANANGAGITIQDAVDSSTDATILWDATNDEFDFSHPVKVAGSLGVTNIVTNKVVKYNGTILDDSNITDTGSAITLGSATTVSGQLEATRLFINVDDGGSSPAMTAYMNIYGYEGRGAGIKIRDSANSASNPSNREWFIGSGYAQSGFNIGYAADGSQSSYAAQNLFALDTSGNATIEGRVTATGLDIGSSTSADGTNGVSYQITDSDSNANFTGLLVDYNLSGSQTLNTNKTHSAILVDMDTTQTGGTSTSGERNYTYGLNLDIRGTGQDYARRGVYAYSETQHSSGTTTENVAIYGYAVADDTGSGHTANNYGARFLSYGYNTGSGGTTSYYGAHALTYLSTAQDKDTATAVGMYAEVQIEDPGQGQTVGSAKAFAAVIDDNDAESPTVTVSNSYLFHGHYTHTPRTNSYGIYIASDVENYFAGAITSDSSGTFANSINLTDDDVSSLSTAIKTLNNGGITIQLDENSEVADTDFRVRIDRSSGDSQLVLDASGNLDLEGNITANGSSHTFYSSDTSNTLSFGRNANEKLVTTVNDTSIELSAHQDSDSNGTHNFILDRHFAGTGANNFAIQKAGSTQFEIDTNGDADLFGNLAMSNSGAGNNITIERSDTSTSAIWHVGSSQSYIGSTADIPFNIWQNGAQVIGIDDGDTTFAGSVTAPYLTVDAGTTLIPFSIEGSSSTYTSMSITNTSSGDAIIWFDASNGDLSGADYASIRQNNGLDLLLRTESNGSEIIFEPGALRSLTLYTDKSSEFFGPVVIDSDNNANGALRVENVVSDTNNDLYFAFEISQTLSGTNAATADREQGGIYMDINSSNTGGDTNHEHRAYGIYIDLDSTGDADNVTGVYSNVTATPSTGTSTNLYGGYFFAEDNGGAGEVTNVYGLQALAYSDNATSDVNNLYGGYFFAYGTNDSGAIGSMTGVYAEIQQDGSTDYTGNSYVFRAEVDNNTGVEQTNTTYLFYGNYAGTQPTTAYGVYIADDVRSRFGGAVETKDGSEGTPGHSFYNDRDTGMYRVTTNELGFSTGGTNRLTLNSSGATFSSGHLLIGSDSGDAFNASALLRIQTAGSSLYSQMKSDTDRDVGLLFGDTVDDFEGGLIYSNTNDSLSFYANNSLGFTIDSARDVIFTQDIETDKIRLSSDTEHYIQFSATSSISGATADTTHINGRQIDLYAYDDIYLRAGSADSIYLWSGADATLTLDSSNNATFVGNVTISGNVLNFDLDTTSDNRGVEFDGRDALTADTADGYLRLNNSSEFTNGVYTPNVVRIDGDLQLAQYLEHYADTNTYLRFVGGDDMQLVAGGRQMIRMDEGANPDVLQFVVSTTYTDSTGQIVASGNITAYASDRRLKTNIKPIENALCKIMSIRGVTYDWRDEVEELGFHPDRKTDCMGVIAQELEEAGVEQVIKPAPFDQYRSEETNWEYVSKSGENYKTVDYDKLTALCIQGIREQQEIINAQQEQINKLMQALEDIKNGDD